MTDVEIFYYNAYPLLLNRYDHNDYYDSIYLLPGAVAGDQPLIYKYLYFQTR